MMNLFWTVMATLIKATLIYVSHPNGKMRAKCDMGVLPRVKTTAAMTFADSLR